MRSDFLLLAAVPLLTGCGLFDALVAATQNPRIAYSEDVPTGLQPRIRVAAIQDDDRGLIFREFDDFAVDGFLGVVKLSPQEEFVAAIHVEQTSVIEARLFVFNVDNGAQEEFGTDNSYSGDFDAICAPVIAAGYADDIAEGIASGNLAPDTTGAAVEFFDSPINEVGLVQWRDDDSILLSMTVEYALTFLAPSGDLPVGPGQSTTVYMTMDRVAPGDWQMSDCEDVLPAGMPVFSPSRDVALGANLAVGQEILLDGAPMLDILGNPLSPDGAERIDGPFR